MKNQNIKTFSDACIACGTTEEAFNEKFKQLDLSPDTVAYEKLKTISAALNGNWKPDFTDHNQGKNYPWFYNDAKPGSAFLFDDCGCFYSATGVGSRLCYKDRETAEYAGKQFIDIYNQFLK